MAGIVGSVACGVCEEALGGFIRQKVCGLRSRQAVGARTCVREPPVGVCSSLVTKMSPVGVCSSLVTKVPPAGACFPLIAHACEESGRFLCLISGPSGPRIDVGHRFE